MKLGLLLFGLGCFLFGTHFIKIQIVESDAQILAYILGFLLIDIPLIYFGIRRLRKRLIRVRNKPIDSNRISENPQESRWAEWARRWLP